MKNNLKKSTPFWALVFYLVLFVHAGVSYFLLDLSFGDPCSVYPWFSWPMIIFLLIALIPAILVIYLLWNQLSGLYTSADFAPYFCLFMVLLLFSFSYIKDSIEVYSLVFVWSVFLLRLLTLLKRRGQHLNQLIVESFNFLFIENASLWLNKMAIFGLVIFCVVLNPYSLPWYIISALGLFLIYSLQKSSPLEIQNLLIYISIIGVFFSLISTNLFFPQFSVADSWRTQITGVPIEIQKLEFVPQEIPTLLPIQIKFGSPYSFSNSNYYEYISGPYISNLTACNGHYLKLFISAASPKPEKTYVLVAISNDSRLMNLSDDDFTQLEKTFSCKK